MGARGICPPCIEVPTSRAGLAADSTSKLHMMIEPPARNIEASSEPYILLVPYVLDELTERRSTAGLPREARMESDGHHLGKPSIALAPQFVEPTASKVEEIIGPLGHLDVIVRKTVRH